MKNDIKQILAEFVGECSEKLKLSGIIQFGSSTYSEDFSDIDLLLFSEEEVVSSKNILNLIKIIKFFETKYKEVVFDFGGIADRKRKAKYYITSVFVGKQELNVQYNSHDLFFFKNLSEDEKIKVLYGKNSLRNKKISLTNKHLFEMLSVDQKHALRKCFDDKESRTNSLYHLFKTFLRAMLVNEGNFKKEELLEKFKQEFGTKIKLPKNSKKIIRKEINEKDFEEILKFTEACLRWLLK